MYRVKEAFYTLQGEGAQAHGQESGSPVGFVGQGNDDGNQEDAANI